MVLRLERDVVRARASPDPKAKSEANRTILLAGLRLTRGNDGNCDRQDSSAGANGDTGAITRTFTRTLCYVYKKGKLRQ